MVKFLSLRPPPPFSKAVPLVFKKTPTTPPNQKPQTTPQPHDECTYHACPVVTVPLASVFLWILCPLPLGNAAHPCSFSPPPDSRLSQTSRSLQNFPLAHAPAMLGLLKNFPLLPFFFTSCLPPQTSAANFCPLPIDVSLPIQKIFPLGLQTTPGHPL